MSSLVTFQAQLASIMDVLVRSAVAELSKLGSAVLRLEMSPGEQEDHDDDEELEKKKAPFPIEQRTTQLASIMATLAKAAVAEISKLADDGFAVLRLEMSRNKKENEGLKRKIELMESELRTAGRHGESAVASRSVGVQVGYSLEDYESGGAHSPGREGVPLKGWRNRVWIDGETIAVKLEGGPLQCDAVSDESADVEDDRPEIMMIKEENLEEDLWSSQLHDREKRNVEFADAGHRPIFDQLYEDDIDAETAAAKNPEKWDILPSSEYDLGGREKDGPTLSRNTYSTQSHVFAEQSIEQFICSHCGKSFDCFSAYETHQQIHSGEKPYSCDKCGESFSNLSNLKRHERNFHSGKVTLDGSAYDRFDTKKSHISIPHRLLPGEKPFGCTLCDKSFSKPSLLKKHQVVHTGEKPYSCDICGKSFSYMYSLKSHQITHSGEKPFTCLQCGTSFTKKTYLETHQNTHTGQKPFSCPHCGKRFSQKSNLKAHIRVHTGEKPFRCDECGECFIHANSLKTHKQLHTGEKPYSCDICGKSFSRATHVKIHQRIHTGDKPYSCTTCGKSFSQKGYLKTHQIFHSGIKDFKCLVCTKSFSQASCLKKHQRVHTGEKPFGCDKCGKCFSYLKSLKDHKCMYLK
ncbi:zinc finger protein 883-like [Scleropages formosus]|uniref:zinc finger protein 883-like n=1 Tax=Scleropages formosus TaxID=113540 RepID=UPI0008784938|nr:zinc finger protein 883-like [Scleropages formosus]